MLSFSILEYREGRPLAVVGGTTMPLFSKKGRLKTGPQRLHIWEGREPCLARPTSTPGKVRKPTMHVSPVPGKPTMHVSPVPALILMCACGSWHPSHPSQCALYGSGAPPALRLFP